MVSKQQKIIERINESVEYFADGISKIEEAKRLLLELRIESEPGSSLSITCERITSQLDFYLSEKVRLVPKELDWVMKDAYGKFFSVALDGDRKEWRTC